MVLGLFCSICAGYGMGIDLSLARLFFAEIALPCGYMMLSPMGLRG